MIDAMFEVATTSGQSVIKQGDVGDNFYVVESGEYEVYLKQKGEMPVHTYKAGSAFGELALMYNCPRAATVKTSVAGQLWGLDQVTFRHIVMAANMHVLDDQASFLKSVSILSAHRRAARRPRRRADRGDLRGRRVHRVGGRGGRPLLHQARRGRRAQEGGRQGRHREGHHANAHRCAACLARRPPAAPALRRPRLTPPPPPRRQALFGESAISGERARRQANVVAVGAVTTLKLTRESFTMLLGELRDVMKHNFNHKVLAGMDMFRALSNAERETLIESLEERSFAVGKEILKQGDPGEDFFIIKSGSVRVTQTQQGSTRVETIKEKLGAGEYFGEMALLNSEPRMATITATTEVVCMQLARDTFVSLLGPLSTILNREAEVRKKRRSGKKPIIHMKDLKAQHPRRGTFGRVKLVAHQPIDTPYALGACARADHRARQVEHDEREEDPRDVRPPLPPPARRRVPGRRRAAHAPRVGLGGELFTIPARARSSTSPPAGSTAQRRGGVRVPLTQIVYRDLKPENLLWTARVPQGRRLRLREDHCRPHVDALRTPEYLAPEIIANKGHNLGVDWWAIGILMYEMLVGYPPFCADDPMDIYQKILRGKISFPAILSKNAKDMIAKLLVANPAARLGCLKNKGRDVRHHPFFKPVDFPSLESYSVKAPYVPTIKSPVDTSNFEHYDEDDAEDGRANDKKSTVFADFDCPPVPERHSNRPSYCSARS